MVKSRAVFAVPTAVVDHFLKLASPDAIKVLLYVLRHSGTVFSAHEIAAALSVQESTVEEAFLFWEQANVFDTMAESASAVQKLSPQPAAPAAPVQSTSVVQPKEPAAPVFAPKSSTNYLLRPSELAARVDQDADVRMLFELAEQMLGHPLKSTEQRSLLWMHDYLGLEADVILMLLGYCNTIGKPHVRYVEAIAIRWNEEGITTLSQAQDEVQRMTERQGFTHAVMRAFDMKRKPVTKQQEFIDSWKQRGYSIELITYAYEKTILAIDKLSFAYINTILESWEAAGITDRASAERAGQATAKSHAEPQQHSYDLEELKRLANPF